MIDVIRVGSRLIGRRQKTFIVAEAGVNHNGDKKIAKRLIDAAVEAGADAVKFQTFRTEESVVFSAPLAPYQKKNDTTAKSFYGMLKKLELPFEVFKELAEYAKERGLLFFSKPAHVSAVDILEEVDVPLYKIGSGEINYFSLLQKVASCGKPIILSTGMATLSEIREALNAIYAENNKRVALLHCVTAYPTDFCYANLRAIETLRKCFDIPVGYSDHTLGTEAAVAAVALGACVIEKHFTLDRSLSGPDHKASLEPKEFESMVRQIRNIEVALGTGKKQVAECEKENIKVVRRSLVAALDIGRGEFIKNSMIGCKRPGTGLSDKYRSYFLGKRAKRNIKIDEMLDKNMVEI